MGVPGFFAAIAKRYPLCISRLNKRDANGIEIGGGSGAKGMYDNLYIDVNGIIHNCYKFDKDITLSNSEYIFSYVANYIYALAQYVDPKRLLFVSIDGVASRGKMKQQRERRFAAKYLKETSDTYEGKRFDPNSITAGTVFMKDFEDYMEMFFVEKRRFGEFKDITVIVSGSSVAGEGETKIMEYIRTNHMRKNKNGMREYDIATTHCIYGADADFIPLLLSLHNPHISIMREEISSTFTNKSRGLFNPNKHSVMYMSLLRNYLDIEFKMIFSNHMDEYDMERAIDDFVLMSYFFGNDFLPTINDCYIRDNSLDLVFYVYKHTLNLRRGYLNINGTIDIDGLNVLFNEMGKIEFMRFCISKHFHKGKICESRSDCEACEGCFLCKACKQTKYILFGLFNVPKGHEIEEIATKSAEKFTFSSDNMNFSEVVCSSEKLSLSIVDQYIEDSMGKGVCCFQISNSTLTESETVLATCNSIRFGLLSFLKDNDIIFINTNVTKSKEEFLSVSKSLFGNDNDISSKAQTTLGFWCLDEKGKLSDTTLHSFINSKEKYYRKKFRFSVYDKKNVNKVVFDYFEALQWVNYYYYNSEVPSFEYYYPYHYPPLVSDLYLKDIKEINFKRGCPLNPLEQLSLILPMGSMELLPSMYRESIASNISMVSEYYPEVLEYDDLGRKYDWEGVYKVPVIQDDIFNKVFMPLSAKLEGKERERNILKDHKVFRPNVDEVNTVKNLKDVCYIERRKYLERILYSDVYNDFPIFEGTPYSKKIRLLKNHSEWSYIFDVFLMSPFEPQTLTFGRIKTFASRLLGQVVYTSYPFRKECVVYSMHVGDFTIELSRFPSHIYNNKIRMPRSSIFFSKNGANNIRTFELLEGSGVYANYFGERDLEVTVSGGGTLPKDSDEYDLCLINLELMPLFGMGVIKNSIFRQYSQHKCFVDVRSVFLCQYMHHHHRYDEYYLSPRSIHTGDRVLIIRDDKKLLHTSTVKKVHNIDGRIYVDVSCSFKVKCPKKMVSISKESSMDIDIVSRECGIPRRVVCILTGTLIINFQNGNEDERQLIERLGFSVNLGLDLFSDNCKLRVPDYVEKIYVDNEEKLVFTENTLELLKEYKRIFPDIVNLLKCIVFVSSEDYTGSMRYKYPSEINNYTIKYSEMENNENDVPIGCLISINFSDIVNLGDGLGMNISQISESLIKLNNWISRARKEYNLHKTNINNTKLSQNELSDTERFIEEKWRKDNMGLTSMERINIGHVIPAFRYRGDPLGIPFHHGKLAINVGDIVIFIYDDYTKRRLEDLLNHRCPAFGDPGVVIEILRSKCQAVVLVRKNTGRQYRNKNERHLNIISMPFALLHSMSS